MKTRVLLTLLLVVCILCALTSCKNDSNDEPLTGVYVISDITGDPDGTTIAELKEMYSGMDLNVEDYLYIEFSEGDFFTIIMFGDEEAFGTYTRDGSTLTLTDRNGETVTADISGNKITWVYENGAKLVFEKK